MVYYKFIIFMEKPEAVLFDFGGTLDADGIHWRDRMVACYRQIGVRQPEERLVHAFYAADDGIVGRPETATTRLRSLVGWHVANQLQVLGLDDPFLAARLVECFCTPMEWTLRRNAELLGRLASRFRLGVISNFYGNLSVILDEFAMSPHLEVAIDSALVGVSKPDPMIFKIALDRLGVGPEVACYVGDSFDRDMVPAREAGLGTIWLVGKEPKPCPNPSVVDHSIERLPDLETLLPGGAA